MTDLLDHDAYHSAIVRIATVREQSTTEPPQLLFASVELITSSRPVPDTMQVNAKGVPQVLHVGETKLDLAFRRVAMDAEDAVNWYRSLASNPTLPIPRSTADVGKHDGKPIQTFALMCSASIWMSRARQSG